MICKKLTKPKYFDDNVVVYGYTHIFYPEPSKYIRKEGIDKIKRLSENK